MIGGGLTETLSGRVSVLYQSQSDWIDNGFTGADNALGSNVLTIFWDGFESATADRWSATSP